MAKNILIRIVILGLCGQKNESISGKSFVVKQCSLQKQKAKLSGERGQIKALQDGDGF